ncbi:hypothetical protein Ddye_004893 [Dipteronia dyeriana]|uniref:Uncharacterized protein n=1 Tax=Dipteronia dyeriana TaxID=168575 RepID=A0AAE0CP41_9ROSI|nr:hypothetical protein Ddye_004893 [Dipteronia dyeriana]
MQRRQNCIQGWERKLYMHNVKKGGPNTSPNTFLAAVLEKFKELDVPREILERNIKRATEKGQEAYIEKIYDMFLNNHFKSTLIYLINSYGFSLKIASPEKPDSVIAFLKRHGFSETQISKVISVHPQVLGASPKRTLLPKFEFFYSKGCSSPELTKISSVLPHILVRSLENHIIPAFNYLIDLFKSSEKVVDLVKRADKVNFRRRENEKNGIVGEKR